MEWRRDDTLRVNSEERRVRAIDGMLVGRSAIARGSSEAIVRDDADRAGMSGRRSHEAEYCID